MDPENHMYVAERYVLRSNAQWYGSEQPLQKRIEVADGLQPMNDMDRTSRGLLL